MSLRSGIPVTPQNNKMGSAWTELVHQADVDSDEAIGELAVDEPENRNNMALWTEILNVRHRIHGVEGVRAVLNGMFRRAVDLPTEGDYADMLWQAFIHANLSSSLEAEGKVELDQCLTTEKVSAYAQRLKQTTGRQYSKLYKILVSHCLRIDPGTALKWHIRLKEAGLATSDSFVEVLDELMSISPSREAFKAFFKPVYRQLQRRDLYDFIIASAFRHNWSEGSTILFHRLLIVSGDLPGDAYSQDPRVVKLFRQAQETKPGTSEYDRAVGPGKRTTRLPYATVNREMMNTVLGEVHGIKPKELSDDFCARMFATRAFSVSWVVKGLSLFGAEKLGPLATREMAVRSGSPQVFRDDLRELKAAGLSTGDSMFARLVVKIAEEDNEELWRALLDSDQHPEAYDDAWTQSDLLKFYLEQQEWVSAHLSLLTAFFSGEGASLRAWNQMLQHYMLIHDHPATLSTLQSMMNQEIPLTSYTMDLLRSHILPPRKVGRRQEHMHGPRSFEPAEFVAKAYIYSAQLRKHPRSVQWVEVLKRLGMGHRWEEFERVVLQLLKEPGGSPDEDEYRWERDMRMERLKKIFNSTMRKAVFIWGFQSASQRNQLRPQLSTQKSGSSAGAGATQAKPVTIEWWAQGLSLLQRLKASGFDFDAAEIRLVFVQRMLILFGPAYSTRAINHEARRNNRLSLAHYIRHANEIWTGLIDWVDPELLESGDDARLLPAFFGNVMRVSMKRGEGADIKAWAEVLASGPQYYVEPRRMRAKTAAWEQSPLRVPYRPMPPVEDVAFEATEGPGDALDAKTSGPTTRSRHHAPSPIGRSNS